MGRETSLRGPCSADKHKSEDEKQKSGKDASLEDTTHAPYKDAFELPSWVLDFTHCKPELDEHGHERFLSEAVIDGSRASANSLFRVVQCDGTSIHVNGFIFDEVLHIGHSVVRPGQPDVCSCTQMVVWAELAEANFRERGMSGHELGTYTQTFITTISCGLGTTRRLTLDNWQFSDLIRWQDGPMKVLFAIIRQGSLVYAANRHDECANLISVVREIISATFRAKFFVTKSLRLDLAPLTAAIGDRIAILASGTRGILPSCYDQYLPITQARRLTGS